MREDLSGSGSIWGGNEQIIFPFGTLLQTNWSGGGGEAGIESRRMIQRLASDRKVRGVDWQMGEGSDRN